MSNSTDPIDAERKRRQKMIETEDAERLRALAEAEQAERERIFFTEGLSKMAEPHGYGTGKTWMSGTPVTPNHPVFTLKVAPEDLGPQIGFWRYGKSMSTAEDRWNFEAESIRQIFVGLPTPKMVGGDTLLTAQYERMSNLLRHWGLGQNLHYGQITEMTELLRQYRIRLDEIRERSEKVVNNQLDVAEAVRNVIERAKNKTRKEAGLDSPLLRQVRSRISGGTSIPTLLHEHEKVCRSIDDIFTSCTLHGWPNGPVAWERERRELVDLYWAMEDDKAAEKDRHKPATLREWERKQLLRAFKPHTPTGDELADAMEGHELVCMAGLDDVPAAACPDHGWCIDDDGWTEQYDRLMDLTRELG